MARAMGAMLFADRITARRRRPGDEIYECVPAADFAAHWRARASSLAAGPTVAYRNLQAALRGHAGQDLPRNC